MTYGYSIVIRCRGVQNRTNPIEKLQTESIQTKTAKKPHLAQMYLDRFLTQPHNLVRIAVFILPTEPN